MAEKKMLEAFTIVKRDGQEKAWWVRIGTAWHNNDGSINVILDALPVNGKIQLREPQPKDDRQQRGGGGRDF